MFQCQGKNTAGPPEKIHITKNSGPVFHAQICRIVRTSGYPASEGGDPVNRKRALFLQYWSTWIIGCHGLTEPDAVIALSKSGNIASVRKISAKVTGIERLHLP